MWPLKSVPAPSMPASHSSRGRGRKPHALKHRSTAPLWARGSCLLGVTRCLPNLLCHQHTMFAFSGVLPGPDAFTPLGVPSLGAAWSFLSSGYSRLTANLCMSPLRLILSSLLCTLWSSSSETSSSACPLRAFSAHGRRTDHHLAMRFPPRYKPIWQHQPGRGRWWLSEHH